MRVLALAAGMSILAVQAAAAATVATSFLVRGTDRLDCIVTNVGNKEIEYEATIFNASGGSVTTSGPEHLDAGRSVTAVFTDSQSGFCRVEWKGKRTAVRAHLCRRTAGAAACLHTSEAR
jgi:hypothetical protein